MMRKKNCCGEGMERNVVTNKMEFSVTCKTNNLNKNLQVGTRTNNLETAGRRVSQKLQSPKRLEKFPVWKEKNFRFQENQPV